MCDILDKSVTETRDKMLQKKIRCVNIEYKREKNGHTTVYFKFGCTEEMHSIQQQQQQQSLLSQASWGRLEMKPKRHKGHDSNTDSLLCIVFNVIPG